MYGAATYAEVAYGESPGASMIGGAVDGVMTIIEDADNFFAIGTFPYETISLTGQPPIMVLVVELNLGQLN